MTKNGPNLRILRRFKKLCRPPNNYAFFAVCDGRMGTFSLTGLKKCISPWRSTSRLGTFGQKRLFWVIFDHVCQIFTILGQNYGIFSLNACFFASNGEHQWYFTPGVEGTTIGYRCKRVGAPRFFLMPKMDIIRLYSKKDTKITRFVSLT